MKDWHEATSVVGELTTERFLPNPFHDRPGARVYRTGDQARWRNDGTIELLGRLDGQVKIRGHRIEIGEIEAVLRSHPTVREAVVLAREEAPGETAPGGLYRKCREWSCFPALAIYAASSGSGCQNT